MDEESFFSQHRLFNPAMAVQRYIFARECIKRTARTTAISSVLDLGCHDCSFVRYLKQLPFLTAINCLDAELQHLQRCDEHAKPSLMELLEERSHDLNVNIYHGSALERDVRFRNIDVVTALELVEHLQPAMLPAFTETIFGYIQPQLAIISTPNYEYNWRIREVLTWETDHTEPPKFRDTDHKFEWTRDEFAAWCQATVTDYPNYIFTIDGVGTLIRDRNNQTGFCTQIGVFTKRHIAAASGSGDTDLNPGQQIHQLYRSYLYKRTENRFFQLRRRQ